jgi:hypothetical protein
VEKISEVHRPYPGTKACRWLAGGDEGGSGSEHIPAVKGAGSPGREGNLIGYQLSQGTGGGNEKAVVRSGEYLASAFHHQAPSACPHTGIDHRNVNGAFGEEFDRGQKGKSARPHILSRDVMGDVHKYHFSGFVS